MLSTILFISGGEIFLILLAILVFFGADKIPDFARMMGKGVREFRKATDDIKREFSDNTSGVLDDIKAIGTDLSDSFTKEISAPLEETANETAAAFEEQAKEPDNSDYYYENRDYDTDAGNEYKTETQTEPEANISENVEPESSGSLTENSESYNDTKPIDA